MASFLDSRQLVRIKEARHSVSLQDHVPRPPPRLVRRDPDDDDAGAVAPERRFDV